LAQSVAAILAADDFDDEAKAEAIAESFLQCQTYLARNGIGQPAVSKGTLEPAERAARRFGRAMVKLQVGGDRRVGLAALASAVVDHTLDVLNRQRERHGFTRPRTTRKDDHTMPTTTAYGELDALAVDLRKSQPHLTHAQAFEKVYTDPANRDLAKRERIESNALNVFAVEKSSGAYDELISKAAELRKREPSLTEAQAFERIYTDPANRDLVKRERQESAPPVLVPADKAMSLEPRYVGGVDAFHQVCDESNDAYQQLMELVRQQRREKETEAQAFERIFLDPSNEKLRRSALARPTESSPGRQ
jgi:ribosomal protein L20A (L18A)